MVKNQVKIACAKQLRKNIKNYLLKDTF